MKKSSMNTKSHTQEANLMYSFSVLNSSAALFAHKKVKLFLMLENSVKSFFYSIKIAIANVLFLTFSFPFFFTFFPLFDRIRAWVRL